MAQQDNLSTRQLVFLAADSLAREGIRPTADSVLRKVGRGSKTTVVAALNDWWPLALQKAVDAAAPEGVPEDAYRVVTALYEQLREAAGEIEGKKAHEAFEQDRERAQAQVVEAHAVAEAAVRARDVALDRAERDAEQHKVLDQRMAQLAAETESLREALNDSRSRHETDKAALAAQAQTLAALQRERERLIESLDQSKTQQDKLREQIESVRKSAREDLTAVEDRARREREEDRDAHEKVLSDNNALLVALRADAERDRIERDQRIEAQTLELERRERQLTEARSEQDQLREQLSGSVQETKDALERLRKTQEERDKEINRATDAQSRIAELEQALARKNGKRKITSQSKTQGKEGE